MVTDPTDMSDVHLIALNTLSNRKKEKHTLGSVKSDQFLRNGTFKPSGFFNQLHHDEMIFY